MITREQAAALPEFWTVEWVTPTGRTGHRLCGDLTSARALRSRLGRLPSIEAVALNCRWTKTNRRWLS